MPANSVSRCQPPPASAISSWYAGADLLDAYRVPLPAGAPRDARMLARLALTEPPIPIRMLMATRDLLVSPFGIKSSKAIRAETEGQERIDFFPVLSEDEREVVIGAEDSHLDFRASMRVVEEGAASFLVGTTAVRCHNLVGRLYLTVIRPFHVAVIKAALRRAGYRLTQASAATARQAAEKA